jgi:hypothetical protein
VPAPVALFDGIRWGLLFSTLGFWLPLAALMAWRGIGHA